ncbi:PAS domain-containing protein [Hymenobacter sp. BT523]|uniref:PAS domain-containing sensor histidine kinase n=1 Tax=Hymenobacter sp. BT523 TaxID=2795725 RepID=UPI0018EC5EB4|nr:PAS domain-containing protein [Hymenobacter sp. BT523]MBJ6110886.1 PAS domain-containing protein [Hymenobacter sp. BT523]
MPFASLPTLPLELQAIFPAEELVAGLLEGSLVGVALYRPVRGADGQITDLTIELLNPAAQRILQQPARPAGTYLQYYPHTLATGVFAFHCEALETGKPMQMEVNYQGDGLDNYFRLSAQRVGQGLLVSFDDTGLHSRTAVEQALRESQARERAALAEAEQQRQQLFDLFMQAPACIARTAGPTHVFTMANAPFCELFGNRVLLNLPLREALPELHDQPFLDLLDQVYRTGRTYHGREEMAYLDQANTGRLSPVYFNFIYQATRDVAGQVSGLLIFAYDVTAHVTARQQSAENAQRANAANEELAVINEELQAANEEIRASNAELFSAQLTLHELNQELEARVAERTARLQDAQAEAERQRARLERLFMQAPAAICILDGPDLVYELVNPGYQALFPGRALRGRPILEALPEIANHEVYHTFRRVYETGITHEEYAMLIPFARAEGGELEERFFNYIQQARYDEAGRIDGILVFAFEVTEQVLARRRTEALQAEALRNAEQLVRQRETLYQVFEQTPASVAILRGPRHRFEYLNPGYQALFPGRPLLGQDLAEALPEAVAFGFVALLDQVYTTGEPFFGVELPLQVYDAAGQLLPETYYTFTYQAYREAGATVGVSIFAFDVTQQVLARRRTEALQEEVLRREAQLQELFEQSPVAIAVFRGPEFVIELANPGVCEIWGRTREQVQGQPLLLALPELQGQGFQEVLQGVMSTGLSYIAQEQPAQLMRGGQPTTVLLNYVYQPLRAADGRITGVAAVATDVSEQVAARQLMARINAELSTANQAVSARNDELAAANAQLIRTNQDLDNFVYAASHDLKQPVNNLSGLFEELRHAATFADADEADLLLPMVDEALHQLATTIDDLAAVGQAQRLPELPAETVDLEELTQEVLQTLQPQVLAARARITTDFAARPTISYARANLRTILANLLSNSLKYNDPARTCRVHLSLWVENARPVLLVEDNGLGFDVQRHRDELFHLFRRFHDHTEGTGVGLYLVNRIVQSNGGRVEVESEVGVGTTFRLHL